MLSLPLLKREARATWVLLLAFIGIMAMYVTIVLSMYDPALGSILADFERAMPDLMAAFGMTGAGMSGLVEYASSYLFGFIMLLFPILFSVILSNRLVARYVDTGSMAYLLASPNTRRRIVFTQGFFLWVCVTVLLAVLAGVGVAFCAASFPGELDVSGYLLLHLGVWGLHTLVSGLGFFASCIFNETKYSYLLSAGVPLGCYVLQMVANLGGRFENVKYATFFTLFSPDKLLARDAAAVPMTAALFAAGFALYVLGGRLFVKRSLPL